MEDTMTKEFIIGTRDSALALWQTNWVKEKLQALWPDYKFTEKRIKTQGDFILDVGLAKIGDKGLFTKELEIAMMQYDIDLAVHSMKDIPTKLPEGLTIGAICRREDPFDVVISPHGYKLMELPQGAKVGTSSLRRKAQLLHFRPDLAIHDLRGNLSTRLMKMERDDFDAIILAAAGVKRMGWEERITEYISPQISLPAVGQGAIGIECRDNDTELLKIISSLEDKDSRDAILAERAFLGKLEGGCQIPIGALGRIEGDTLHLEGLVASLDGKRVLRSSLKGRREDAVGLGKKLADTLLQMGAEEILEEVRGL
jgi:hydroxymethylbilane synthase